MMSVYSDVRILMPEENFVEIGIRLAKMDCDDWERAVLNHNNRTEKITKKGKEFILCSWNYIKWDEATNEVIAELVNYVRMLAKNNIPCRYFYLNEFGQTEDIKGYDLEHEFLPIIEGCFWLKQEIAVSDYLYEED